MAELKAGGLALVIGLRNPDEQQYNGRCVTLVQLLGPEVESFRNPITGENLLIEKGLEVAWVVTGGVNVKGMSGPRWEGWAMIPPSKLIPLDEDFLDETTKERELTHG